jgi:5-methylcytosine-specific restriction endonuclease McrA
MNALLGILAVITAIWVYGWLREQWEEWCGAFGRWRKGEPLKSSKAVQIRLEEARRKLSQERQRMRHAYEISPANILNKRFRARFIEIGVAAEIRAEVRAKHKDVCAVCKRKIRSRHDVCIDHIRPKKHHPQLEFWSANLQVLCRSCNSHKSAYDGWDWEEVTIARKKKTLRQKRRQTRLPRTRSL